MRLSKELWKSGVGEYVRESESPCYIHTCQLKHKSESVSCSRYVRSGEEGMRVCEGGVSVRGRRGERGRLSGEGECQQEGQQGEGQRVAKGSTGSVVVHGPRLLVWGWRKYNSNI